ncbi:tRNA-queuosine alpha-mannosyltransferase domain-containing protein [Spirochaeta africana]|uniref:tRNA-queuosine alpha-mannosyltransferase n=1 Tax=Spirochaeta africana (strain ATCC 700263 / DSM 8902 / Z-7692) TaxID=889378 RepID=H9UIL6_SPIAZ|nr:DUF3524 domain-containing protein [Spirochaeta africana]AFG37359.1 glycosyltransferase [Spirochaeta africana DSM 8902]
MKEKLHPSLSVLYLESFYGGSHRDFADGVCTHSRHSIDLRTLPAEMWKRRIRHAALQLVGNDVDPQNYDAVLSGGMMNLADLRALWGADCPRLLMYAHETQFSYPVPEKAGSHDEFLQTDIRNLLIADAIAFNSETHRTTCLTHIREYCARVGIAAAVADVIGNKSCVIYPGCWFEPDNSYDDLNQQKTGSLRIVWNHRWEYDKAPDVFLETLRLLASAGSEFQLLLLGDHTSTAYPIPHDLQKRILHAGYVGSRAAYYRMLSRGDVVVSTALQENFGIAVVEAMYHGCLPLLPARLSYPELLPAGLQEHGLYESPEQLQTRLAEMCTQIQEHGRRQEWRDTQAELQNHMARYAWQRRIADMDSFIAGRVDSSW